MANLKLFNKAVFDTKTNDSIYVNYGLNYIRNIDQFMVSVIVIPLKVTT